MFSFRMSSTLKWKWRKVKTPESGGVGAFCGSLVEFRSNGSGGGQGAKLL